MAAAERYDVDVKLRIDAAPCPTTPEPSVRLEDLRSDGGAVSFADVVCPAPVVGVDCLDQCSGACVVGGLVARGNTLKAVKSDSGSGPRDIRFQWAAAPDFSTESHVNQLTRKDELRAPQAHRPPAPGIAAEACTAAEPRTTCTQFDVVPGPPNRLFYQLVSACGPSGLDEGPFE